jgi:hypothetical protein
MNRRKFLKLSAVGGLVVVISGGAITWVAIEESSTPLTSASIIQMIDKLASQKVISNGGWSPYKVFVHCAQSVDYSIDGYPNHKSTLFKNTAGKVAFSLFTKKRKMTHNLTEAIPGAPLIEQTGNISESLASLKTALIRFEQFNGALKPHFAYGELSKSQYELAHAMHFVNHLKALTVKQ